MCCSAGPGPGRTGGSGSACRAGVTWTGGGHQRPGNCRYYSVLSFEHEDPVMSPEDGCEKAIAFLKPLIIKKPLKQPWW